MSTEDVEGKATLSLQKSSAHTTTVDLLAGPLALVRGAKLEQGWDLNWFEQMFILFEAFGAVSD